MSLFVASKARTVGSVCGMRDRDLTLSMVVMGYPNILSLSAGECELEYQGEALVEIIGSWLRNHSSKLAHFYGSRAGGLRLTMRRKLDEMQGVGCV